jgi:hypothetical protein
MTDGLWEWDDYLDPGGSIQQASYNLLLLPTASFYAMLAEPVAVYLKCAAG